MKTAYIILLALVLLACTGLPPQNFSPTTVSAKRSAGWNAADVAAYRTFISDRIASDKIAGVATAIVRGDEIILLEGFGKRDVVANLPVTEETFFHIASITKSFTALLMATLVDDGVVDWDEPAIQIYPDFALETQQATDTVTLRHLLNMSSGIADYNEDDFDIDNSTAQDVLPFLESAELLAAPGQQFSYSNLSTTAAGYLAVIAESGQDDALYDDYADLLEDTVLQPMGMTTARVRVSDVANNPNYGKSYILDGGVLVEADPEDFDGDPLAPSGSIKANVREMAIYVQTQLNEGVAPNGTRIVAANTIREMWQPALEDYGLGWETVLVGDVDVVLHEGSFDNYLSVVGFMPDRGVGFVVLTNSADSAETFLQDVVDEIVENSTGTPTAVELNAMQTAQQINWGISLVLLALVLLIGRSTHLAQKQR